MNTKTKTTLNTPIEELNNLQAAHEYLMSIQRASWADPTNPRWRITSLFASGYTAHHIAEVTGIDHYRIIAAINHTHKGVNTEKILRATATTSRNRLISKSDEELIASVKWWCEIDSKNRSSGKYGEEYSELGLPSTHTLRARFGSWDEIMEKAGYESVSQFKRNNRNNVVPKDLSPVREYVSECRSKQPSSVGFGRWCKKNDRGSGSELINRYGGWNNLLLAAFPD